MFYPPDVATVAILMYFSFIRLNNQCSNVHFPNSLSWADTTASTFGRLWGYKTPRLPARTPILGLPLAPRKSLAGFIAAATTGALIAFGFWGWIAPLRQNGADLTWRWDTGVSASSSSFIPALGFIHHSGGWTGLGTIGLVSGLVSGVAEALGELLDCAFRLKVEYFYPQTWGRSMTI